MRNRGMWSVGRSAGRACALTMAALALLAVPVWAEQEADYQKLLAAKAPATVTVKFVLKLKSSWGESEAEREVTGVVIAADGLVLCANSQLSGGAWLRRSGATATPTDIKVLIGEDTEGREAKIIARDTELDLSWLRIEQPGEKLALISLEHPAIPEIGERLYTVSRLAKYFDRVAVVGETRLGGITAKPRRLYVPSGGSGELGLPVYNAQGQVVGVSISQMPDPDEMEPGGGFFGGEVLILPAEEVMKATRRALESARDEDREESDEHNDQNRDRKGAARDDE
jgi:S1-C subfamily serine protease